MANILEYTLSLQDQMSASLKKIGVNSDSALNKFAALEKQAKEVKGAFKSMGTSIFTLKQKIDLLKAERNILPANSIKNIKQYNKEINKLEKKISKLENRRGSRIGGMFKDAFKSLPAFATNPLILAGAGIGASVKKGMEFELQKTNMLTLLEGDLKKTENLIKRLTNFALDSPYDKVDIIEGQSLMMSFGIESEKAFNAQKKLGDISLGDKDRFKRLNLAFAQSMSAGKLMGQDLNQMVQAGFNPLNVIAEKTGESIVSLREKMSKGQITTNELTMALQWATEEGGKWHDGAKKAADTPFGKMQKMFELFNEVMIKVYDILRPLVLPALEGLIGLLNIVAVSIPAISTFMSDYSTVLLGVASIIGILTALYYAETIALKIRNFQAKISLIRERISNGLLKIKSFWIGVVTGATWLWNAAQSALNITMWANPVTWIITGVIALIAGIAYLIFKIDGWKQAWSHALKSMQLHWQGFKALIKLGWMALSNSILSVIDKIKIAWFRLKSAFGDEDAKASIASIKAQGKARMDQYAKQKKLQKENVKLLAQMAVEEKIKASNALKWNASKSVMGTVKDKLGIGQGILDPSTPGTNNGATEQKPGAGLSESIGRSNNAIATGGTKSTTLNLDISKVVETININKAGFGESVQKMEEMITESLVRVLQTANAIAS